SDIVVSSRGRGADVRPPVPRLVASGLERLETTAQNLDLARLRALQDGNPYGQHAVRVGRLDLVAVEVLRQVDAAGEGAHRALGHEAPLAVEVLLLTAGADAEDAPVDGDVDGVGVDAGQVDPERHVLVAAHAVHRHDGATVEGLTGEPVELPLELLDERVDGRQEHV